MPVYPQFQLGQIIAREDVHLDIRANGKNELLDCLSRHAAKRTSLPAASVYSVLQSREKLGSTGLGGGIAIPHARPANLERPFALAVRLKAPCDFEAIDDQPVDLVVLLLVPPTMSYAHLALLARVARLLRDPALAERLRRAVNADEFHAHLKGKHGHDRAL